MPLDNSAPKHKTHYWWALGALLGLVGASYLATYLLAEREEKSAHGFLVRSILENTTAGLVTALVIALTFRLIIMLIEPGDRVIEVAPDEVSTRLQRNARSTKSYKFIGNTATFVTASILPILCAQASRTQQTFVVRLFIIDPRQERIVSAYVRHKNRVKLAGSRIADAYLAAWVQPVRELDEETSDSAKAKLYAALYLCAYASKSSGIDLIVHLRPSFTPFRADVSDREAILTQESPNDSVVAFSSVGHFYGWYHKEAEALALQSDQIEFSRVVDFQIASPSEAEAGD